MIISGIIALFCLSCIASDHQISFNVRRQGTKSSVKTNWQSSYGSSDKDTSRQVKIEIEMRNMAREDDSFIVKWYFISKPIDAGEPRVFDSGDDSITLKPMEVKKIFKQSQAITSNTRVWAFDNSNQREGEKIAGYIVVLANTDGSIFAVSASSKPFEDLAKDKERLAKLTGEDVIESGTVQEK